MYIDTHCHLADSAFDTDRDAVIERARAAGVERFVEIAESPDTWEGALALAERHAFFYASLGIHPHHAHQAGPEVWPSFERRLRELLQHPKAMAVGEFGLDYFRMQNTREQQDYVFRKQLELARELNKPIVIHCREAHADVQKMLAEFYPGTTGAREIARPHGVIHCFSGAWEDAQFYFLHGFMIGVDGPVTYPKSKALKEVVTRAPLERLVLETDSPYLPPQTHRGQRNDSSHLPAIAAAIAELKHSTPEAVATRTTENARALFRIRD